MILVLISLILDGIVSVYTNNTILIPLFTLTSLVYIYKYYEKKENIYFLIALLIGILYDSLYTDIILLNSLVFLFLAVIIKILNIYLSHKLSSTIVKLLAIIILYRITTYLILVLFNYIDFNFIYLFKSIYSSVLINIIYLIIVTLIYKKISSK